MLAEVPFGKDGDYSDTSMLACANGFLANALGNLQMRVTWTAVVHVAVAANVVLVARQ